MPLKIIDCSRYDNGRVASGVLNFADAKRSGVFAGVCRWGVGSSKDAYFTQNLVGIHESELQPGSYWVPYPGNDHVADAKNFLRDVNSVLGTLNGVAITLDVEDFTGGAHLSRAEVEVCRNVLGDALGRHQIDYIPRWWLQSHESENWQTLPTADPWWDSAYPYGNNPPPPDFMPTSRPPYDGWTPAAWQFTSSGQIPGMSDRTDVSSFFGSTADWARVTGGSVVATLDSQDYANIANAVATKLAADRLGYLYAVRQEVITALGDDSHTYLKDETQATINGVMNGVTPMFTALNAKLNDIANTVAAQVIANLPAGVVNVDYGEIYSRARQAVVDVLTRGTVDTATPAPQGTG